MSGFQKKKSKIYEEKSFVDVSAKERKSISALDNIIMVEGKKIEMKGKSTKKEN